MSLQFPRTPNFSGWNAPVRAELDLSDLEVTGTLPPDMRGSFYRVGPDPQFPPKAGDDIFFNGDGLVSLFRFVDGRVEYRSRYVRTDKFKAERQAGRALFGAYRNPYTDDESVQGMIRGTANTGVWLHNGQLWALKEDSPPVLMDPDTLATHGYHFLDGALANAQPLAPSTESTASPRANGLPQSRTFTAHPHFDAASGDMHAIGFAAKGEATPDIVYYCIDKHGRITHEVWLQAPYAGMVHDFAVTADYIVFPIVPITSNVEWLKQRRPHYHWDPRVDVYMGVLPRRKADGSPSTSADLRWFRGHNRYSTHIFNGWNEGGKIYIDTPVAKGNPFPFFPDITGAPFNLDASAPHISRWIIDMDAPGEGFEEVCFDDQVCEFSRIDDRFQTRKHRYGYVSTLDIFKPWTTTLAPEKPLMMFNSMSRFDFEEKKLERWWIGEASTLEEVQFVPRSEHAPEGEGWLIGICQRHAQGRSDLVILDAMKVAAGPVATVHLPIRVRNGLHGSWVAQWQRDTQPILR